LNKEILECYIKSIDDELEMYKGSMSPQILDYLKDLISMRKKLEKMEYEDEHGYDEKEDKKDLIKGTLADERIENQLDEIKGYMEYKKMYEKTHKQTDLDMAKDELSHFLQALTDTFEEVEKLSRDDMEDRMTIKKYIKQIYQDFNM
jgi:hypothetical protein